MNLCLILWVNPIVNPLVKISSSFRNSNKEAL